MFKFLKCPSTENKRVVDVGWFLQTQKAGFMWEEPRNITRNDVRPQAVKSVAYCPAVLDYEARMFEIPCPIDLRLRCRFDEKGKFNLITPDGERSAVRSNRLNELLTIVSRNEWRHPDRPIIQIMTPYTFIADEQVYIMQMPAFMNYNPELPGVVIGGRLPIHIWPRVLMWAFEWYDTKKDLVLTRGHPWFYARFETQDPSRQIRLFEAENTPALQEYLTGMNGVTNYMSRTFSLFKTATKRRPKQLLVRKKR